MESRQRDHWKRAMTEEIDDISMSYPEAATKATIEVKAKLREIYDHEPRPGMPIPWHRNPLRR